MNNILSAMSCDYDIDMSVANVYGHFPIEFISFHVLANHLETE